MTFLEGPFTIQGQLSANKEASSKKATKIKSEKQSIKELFKIFKEIRLWKKRCDR